MFLVCGDSMRDIYIQAQVERISPEAPVPIARVKEQVEKPGGAANVLMNVQVLGMPVRGLYSISALDAPVEKIRVMSRSQQMLRLDKDRPQTPIPPESFEPEDYIIFSDYGKGSLVGVSKLLRKSIGSVVFVDPKGVDYDKYKGASYIKPNKFEMRDIVGGWVTEAALEAKAFNVVHSYGLKGLLLTRAEEGMTLFTRTVKHHVPSQAQEVFDVCGAGDTAIATFAVAIAKDFSEEEAVFLATKAAGITCQHLGSYSPTYKEVFGD